LIRGRKSPTWGPALLKAGGGAGGSADHNAATSTVAQSITIGCDLALMPTILPTFMRSASNLLVVLARPCELPPVAGINDLRDERLASKVESFLKGKYGDKIDNARSSLPLLRKSNGSEVPFAIFTRHEYAHISAVIWNSSATWGKVKALNRDQNNVPTVLGKYVSLQLILIFTLITSIGPADNDIIRDLMSKLIRVLQRENELLIFMTREPMFPGEPNGLGHVIIIDINPIVVAGCQQQHCGYKSFQPTMISSHSAPPILAPRCLRISALIHFKSASD